ncbi:hypothetical protein [Mesorhizobium sp. M7D.F.Ca.US.004.01.2.1]|nr:hypothetical protein [Mesorhizobium sp. M7D.F.Ca.US.004.01.2.1]RUX97456.1 hypothetical protein EN993_03910 [Mesorhizobium sp. M7D.F.Ca.US.004.01.2.1]
MNDPTNAATLNAKQSAKLLGVGRTRWWQLRKQFGLQRVAWSSEGRPRYRREDVLAIREKVPREDGLIEGSPEWLAEITRLAQEAAEAAGEPGR